MLTAKRLGQTDLAVSPVGLGTVKLGRNQQVKYPTEFTLPSDAQVVELLDRARGLGVNLIDTAPAYGTSEERLGRLLGSRRDDWIIVSKAGEDFVGGRSHFDFSPAAITASVERTLLRLRTDRVESLLLHSDGNDLDILDHSGAVETLFALKEQGKIRSAGISTKTVAGGLRAVALGLDVVMATFSKSFASIGGAAAVGRQHDLQCIHAVAYPRPGDQGQQRPGMRSGGRCTKRLKTGSECGRIVLRPANGFYLSWRSRCPVGSVRHHVCLARHGDEGRNRETQRGGSDPAPRFFQATEEWMRVSSGQLRCGNKDVHCKWRPQWIQSGTAKHCATPMR